MRGLTHNPVMRRSNLVGGVVLGVVTSLRRAGVSVSTGEAVDAARALEAAGLDDPLRARDALRTALVKRRADLEVFDRAVDAALAAGRTATAVDQLSPGTARAGGGEADSGNTASTALLQRLVQALSQDEPTALRTLATFAVDQHGGITAGARSSERAYVYRILRRLDLAALIQSAMRQRSLRDGDTKLVRALDEAEIAARAEEFRRLLAVEVRRRLDGFDVAAAGAVDLAVLDPMDTNILGASPSELAEMRRVLRPLARRLAARAARRNRRGRSGRLDVRRTVRASLSTGGVPVRPAWRRPRMSRPELVLLCDISGSVAEFAGFTLALMSAMSAEFSRVRSFAFVDDVDEVTHIVLGAGGPLLPQHLLARANVIWRDGHSDYGRVLEHLTTRFPDALTPRTTLVITGDARTNHRAHGAGALADIAHRVRAVHWLNPEPRDDWDTVDSVISLYARSVDSVHEVRTLRQLEAAALHIVAAGRAI